MIFSSKMNDPEPESEQAQVDKQMWQDANKNDTMKVQNPDGSYQFLDEEIYD